MDLEKLKQRVQKGNYKISKHAKVKYNMLGISTADIEQIVTTGEVIKEYPNEKPYPECLILGYVGDEPRYVVVACNDEAVIVTVHEYDPSIYESDYKTRRKKK